MIHVWQINFSNMYRQSPRNEFLQPRNRDMQPINPGLHNFPVFTHTKSNQFVPILKSESQRIKDIDSVSRHMLFAAICLYKQIIGFSLFFWSFFCSSFGSNLIKTTLSSFPLFSSFFFSFYFSPSGLLSIKQNDHVSQCPCNAITVPATAYAFIQMKNCCTCTLLNLHFLTEWAVPGCVSHDMSVMWRLKIVIC